MTENAANIQSTSDPTFEADVYGQTSLVVVDFWASWCAPCRMLMPVLEKVAQQNQSWIKLVKVDTDQCPQAAGKFGIQGVPAVFAIVGDSVVDSFQGALPEVAVANWLLKLKPLWELQQLDKLLQDDPQTAKERLTELVAQSPNSAAYVIKLAQLLLDEGSIAEAQQLIARLEARGFLEPEATKLKAQLELKVPVDPQRIEQLREALKQSPADHAVKLSLAEALASSGDHVESCELCLQLVSADRKATGEKARELMINIFRVLPDDSEITSKYRRQLALALY
jgi:putative thioredoxin